ncbi:hypothetical protein [Aureimonas leprariae]|uniref:hypothetical protein n=1 Tax=Plantimonas leprariae TaxID=2615207 RepID=UPI001FE966F4|nr:hypothetical protein [Aureimonas leprariae]
MSVSSEARTKRAQPGRTSPLEGEPATAVLAGLRAAVARIEGTPQRFSESTPQRFSESTPQRSSEAAPERSSEAAPERRRVIGEAGAAGSARRADVLSLGCAEADRALGGGWPRAGLAELHGDDTQGVGAATGFALALGILFGASPERPLIWIGTTLAFREAGKLHGPGLLDIGLDPRAFLCVGTSRLADAVWAAEEAARAGLAALAVLEVRGNPALLELEGTRRLHLRAGGGGAPLVLLRQGGRAEATAAPLRLRVAAGPSPSPSTGIPAFRLGLEKARGLPPQEIVVGWNVHERCFGPPRPFEPRQPDAFVVLAPTPDRPDQAAGSGTRLALGRRAS